MVIGPPAVVTEKERSIAIRGPPAATSTSQFDSTGTPPALTWIATGGAPGAVAGPDPAVTSMAFTSGELAVPLRKSIWMAPLFAFPMKDRSTAVSGAPAAASAVSFSDATHLRIFTDCVVSR